MRYANNILISFVSMLVLVACQTTIPNVRVYKEIPFLDAPEAVYVESSTWKEGFISHADWQKKRPYMLMIDPEGWKAIKDQWYYACRKAGPQGCSQQIDSIDGLIKWLDHLASVVLKP